VLTTIVAFVMPALRADDAELSQPELAAESH